jgi:hypothetical protein
MAQMTMHELITATFLFIEIPPSDSLIFYKILACDARKKFKKFHEMKKKGKGLDFF